MPVRQHVPRQVTLQIRRGRHDKALWVTVGRGTVLYRDSELILVRQMGSHGLYNSSGYYLSAGYKKGHPVEQKLRRGDGGWRIHPSSMERLG